MKNKTNTTATARIEIEISCSSSWGPDCTMEQVHKQATEAAQDAIRELFQSERFRVTGSPVILAINTKTRTTD